MRRIIAVSVWLATLVRAASATPGPGPGEPFGFAAGCVPPTSERLKCSLSVARLYAKLETAIVRCQTRQAQARYSTVVLGRPKTFDEAGCKAMAMSRFDERLAKLANHWCADSPLLYSAAADRTALLAQMETRSGDVYCDATTAEPLDPSGGDDGFVPASNDARRCTDRVAKNLTRLAGRVWNCHRKAADRGFDLADPPFDEPACQINALEQFDTAATEMEATGTCPSCLAATTQHTLGLDVTARLDSTNDSAFPCGDPILHIGNVQIDRPTLTALGVQLLVSGDENRNASVAVRYRIDGTGAWKQALPLQRVYPEDVEGLTVPEQFAGSIFDLRPATTYEVELNATDIDGGVNQALTFTSTTRAVPRDPTNPRVVMVSSTAGLNAALAAAQAGDVISLANAVYSGPFVLSKSGTATNPIVIRGASTAGTILDGGGCTCNALEVYGSFVHVERLTLRNANRALRFQTAGAEGNVARRLRTYNTQLGFGSRQDQRDSYICDNEMEGPLTWPHIYFDDNGANSNVDGIVVQGYGHVVCHNRLIGFGDALKNLQPGSRALDFYGNEVLSAYDNGLELDYGAGNVRALRNRFTNNFMPISFQPLYGGPAYAVRNVAVNITHEQLKFHGVGSDTGPSGVLVYHNTFVSPDTPLILETSATSHHFDIVNNLFVGPAMLPGRVVDWLGPIDDGDFDYNGYFPNGVFRFNWLATGLTSYPNLAALMAAGIETHGVLLAHPIFANGLVPPPDYTTTMAPADVTLAASTAAVDAAIALPNINDGWTGAGPDLGALERGCPLPIFGMRPEGIDESNEPFGCEP